MLVERDGPVTTVTIDRPEVRNAVDGPTAEALAEAFREFDADDDASVAVLTGAGGHLLRRRRPQGGRRRAAATGSSPTATARWVRPGCGCRKPVIAAIEGYAVAGGLELALWCDLRVAAEDAVLGVFCRRWGVPLIDGGTVRLPRLIGQSRAMDLVLTGRAVGADGGLRDRPGQPAVRRRARPWPRPSELAARDRGVPADLRCGRTGSACWSSGGSRRSEALAVELAHGLVSLGADALAGRTRFAEGAGRHGGSDGAPVPEGTPPGSAQGPPPQ